MSPQNDSERFVNYLSALVSARDRVALLIALTSSLAFAILTGMAGYGGFLVGGFYSSLIIPCIVIYSDKWKLLVWQVCIVAFVFFLAAWAFDDWQSPPVRTVASFAFVCWSLATVVSLPVPAGFYILRFKGSWRYLAGVVIGVTAFLLLAAVHRITG